MNAQALASFIWSIAELLRGDYKQSDYGKVILPFTVLRRLDCVLEPTKSAVLAELERCKRENLPPAHFLIEASQQSFFNSSAMDLGKLLGDPANLRANLLGYVNGFSENVRDIFEKFEFEKQVERLDGANLLFLIVQKFASVDLHPKAVSNAAMGHLFEELIRRFAELSNETAGEHFTPREVIRLMVNLLFLEDDGGLTTSGAVRTIYDPTAGTGGMLSVAEEHLLAMNPKAKLAMHGQELNPESYAICKADMLVKGQDVSNIVFGNTLSNDGHAGKKFDYMLSNPPFGVEWKKVEEVVRKENETQGHAGRFGPGLPRVSDGSLLFLLHLVSKMRDPKVGGSRIGIVFNGSPLFTGGAGSGESEIRKYLFENDLVEAIVALPSDMFYNTGIGTYVWIVSNRKSERRYKKVQLIDGSHFSRKMRKSLGSKRKELSADDIDAITQVYGDFQEADRWVITDKKGGLVRSLILPHNTQPPEMNEGELAEAIPVSKIYDVEDFGYRSVTVELPLRLCFVSDKECIERLRRLRDEKKKGAPSGEEFSALEKVLVALMPRGRLLRRVDAQSAVEEVLRELNLELGAGARKSLWSLIERRDASGELQKDQKGRPLPDADLRDVETVPLREDPKAFVAREIHPRRPEAWIDDTRTKLGYEVPFSRSFYVYRAPRNLRELDEELAEVTNEIRNMIGTLSA
jgi:type I restriction enzyme M protein